MDLGRIIALIKSLSGGSSLPPVTSSDNGKVLGVVDGEWAASEQGKKFIVTLTPTALDYSGTMDKTVAEINAAYEAGMEIWFKMLYDQSGSYVEIPASVQHGSGATSEGFFAFACYNDILIQATTGVNPAADETTYSTYIYALTPAS